MARIVQALTQPDEDYNQQTQQSFVRDVDSIVQKLNTTYQQDLNVIMNQTIEKRDAAGRARWAERIEEYDTLSILIT